jgi:hypothetical protein
VIASFRLSGKQWHIFSRFFQQNPRDILTPAHLGPFPSTIAEPFPTQACPICTADGLPACNCGAHAVIQMQDTGGHLKLLNSWGSGFADRGHFRVRDAATLRLTLYELTPVRTPAEKQAFMLRGCQAVLRMADLCPCPPRRPRLGGVWPRRPAEQQLRPGRREGPDSDRLLRGHPTPPRVQASPLLLCCGHMGRTFFF